LQKVICNLKIKYQMATQPEKNKKDREAWLKFCIFMTFCTIGMRVSELVALKLTDLKTNVPNPRIKIILKGGKIHEPLIPTELSSLLELYLKRCRRYAGSNDPLFALHCYSKRPLSREYVARMISKIAKENGIAREISPHSCRATVASVLHKNNVPIGEIQELLGHRSISTTMLYIRKTNELEESAAMKNPILNLIKEKGKG